MYKRIAFFLSVAMLSYNVCVFADAVGEKIDRGSDLYESSGKDVGIDVISADGVVEMRRYEGWKDGNEIFDDEILGDHQMDQMDSVSDDRIPEEDVIQTSGTISQDGILEEEYIPKPDIISGDEILEDDMPLSDTLSNNEISDEEERLREIKEESEGPDETVSSGNMDPHMEKQPVFRVSLPRNIHGYLDPGNIAEKGGVYSDEYKIINYGNTDVTIKVKKINVSYKEEKESYEFSENMVGDEGSDLKKINIDTVWKNESEDIEKILSVVDGDVDEYVLYLEASEYDENNEFVKLNDGSVGSFFIRGTLNQNTDVQWSDNEIALQLEYRIQSVKKAEEGVQNALAVVEEKGENEEY